MDKHTICLLNDSFPPIIDGVANAVVNYAENIEKHHGHAVVVTPAVPGADDSGFPFPVVRYPSIDTRRLVGYVAGYPFSPETALRVREEKVELLHTHCPIASAILARSLREVVDAIAAVPTSPADRPLTPVRIKSITLVDETCDEEPETV